MDQIHTTVYGLIFVDQNPRNVIHHENFYVYGIMILLIKFSSQIYFCTLRNPWKTLENVKLVALAMYTSIENLYIYRLLY